MSRETFQEKLAELSPSERHLIGLFIHAMRHGCAPTRPAIAGGAPALQEWANTYGVEACFAASEPLRERTT